MLLLSAILIKTVVANIILLINWYIGHIYKVGEKANLDQQPELMSSTSVFPITLLLLIITFALCLYLYLTGIQKTKYLSLGIIMFVLTLFPITIYIYAPNMFIYYLFHYFPISHLCVYAIIFITAFCLRQLAGALQYDADTVFRGVIFFSAFSCLLSVLGHSILDNTSTYIKLTDSPVLSDIFYTLHDFKAIYYIAFFITQVISGVLAWIIFIPDIKPGRFAEFCAIILASKLYLSFAILYSGLNIIGCIITITVALACIHYYLQRINSTTEIQAY